MRMPGEKKKAWNHTLIYGNRLSQSPPSINKQQPTPMRIDARMRLIPYLDFGICEIRYPRNKAMALSSVPRMFKTSVPACRPRFRRTSPLLRCLGKGFPADATGGKPAPLLGNSFAFGLAKILQFTDLQRIGIIRNLLRTSFQDFPGKLGSMPLPSDRRGLFAHTHPCQSCCCVSASYRQVEAKVRQLGVRICRFSAVLLVRFFLFSVFSGMATPFVQWGKIVTFGMAFDFHYR